jgi:hypothetical protein
VLPTLFKSRTNSEGQVKYRRCTFLDMPRRIAQERVPTASNVGSRDVTWASQPTPLIPFRVFSRVSRAPFLLLFKILFASFCKDWRDVYVTMCFSSSSKLSKLCAGAKTSI